MIATLVCSVVGPLLFLAAWRDTRIVRRLRRRGITVPGLVTRRERSGDPDGPKWAFVIAYTDHRGLYREFTPQARGVGLGLPVGRQVPVLFMPDKPEAPRVGTRAHTVIPPVAMAIGGALFLGVGALAAVAG
ncbi:DUF3592 domain-containing protein [Streptomyces sp. GESEQ-35]|uniref:DUF3592 domain-containing protein n=1 Tax=Streptomyces sp. GESEQ-35 TaxID=2812657 RepID=UPI001B32A9F7|nr:DUF3592 domain-containing protein [Streptomyces sp. GESEQ-35]